MAPILARQAPAHRRMAGQRFEPSPAQHRSVSADIAADPKLEERRLGGAEGI